MPMRYALLIVIALAPGLAAQDAKPVKFGPLAAVPPADWKTEKPANRLRSHQFKLASGDEGLADAEVIVMPESKPKPEQVFPGWKEQFTPPDGKTLADVAMESKLEVGTATLHVLDIRGTWKYKERPFDPKSKLEMKPEYRVIWVIVATADEATHVRLSGPEKTVEKHKKAFDGWLKAMK
jgi:hypothetical protein